MRFTKPLLSLCLLGSVGYASSLAVYQDRTFYTYAPTESFIGYTQGVTAKCNEKNMEVVETLSCPQGQRLCDEMEAIKEQELLLGAVDANLKTLDTLVSLPRPTAFDAASWIDAAKMIGQEKATLLDKEKRLTQAIRQQKDNFFKQAPTDKASTFTQNCSDDVTLTIPYGYVSFTTEYEADLANKEIEVRQNLSITNRSGVDIEVDEAMFYYRSARQHVNPIHFNPWIVSKYVPRPKKVYKKSMRQESEDMMVMAEAMSMQRASAPRPAPVASYEDAREYKITNLKLPSSGQPMEVNLLSWKAPLKCELRAYPYVNARAFELCSFTPKYQIESNSWKVKEEGKLINENAQGEYHDEKYKLYTKVEEDIQIKRKPIVQKERETGIFGGKARKKDGFVVILTNKSDEAKELTVIERIPTSTTDEITSKLLSVKSEKKIDYKLLKDGKVEMKIALAPNEVKRVEVLFEISYDKELKVNY